MNLRRAFAGYQVANLRPMTPLSLLAAACIYTVAVLTGGHVIASWILYAPLPPMLLLAIGTMRVRKIRLLILLSLTSVLVVEAAINIAGIGLVDGLAWATPGCLMLPLAIAVFWPSRRVFATAMVLAAFGPLPMLLVRNQKGLELLQFSVYMAGAVSLATMMFLVMERTLRRQLQLEQQLRAKATIDGLTGLLLRNHFLDRAEQALARLHGESTPVCMAYLDADRFKQLNDVHGHDAGDAALAGLAACLRDHVRSHDLVGRVGGEEFAMLLPRMSLPSAQARMEKIRQAARDVQRPDGPLTLSIGLAQSRSADESIVDLMVRAENAMRQAKKAGRDRVVMDQATTGHTGQDAGTTRR